MPMLSFFVFVRAASPSPAAAREDEEVTTSVFPSWETSP